MWGRLELDLLVESAANLLLLTLDIMIYVTFWPVCAFKKVYFWFVPVLFACLYLHVCCKALLLYTLFKGLHPFSILFYTTPAEQPGAVDYLATIIITCQLYRCPESSLFNPLFTASHQNLALLYLSPVWKGTKTRYCCHL